MRTGLRGPRVWGLAVSAAIHGLLWFAFVRASEPASAPQANPGRVMTVALVAPPKPATAAAQPDQPEPEAPAEEAPAVDAQAVREELHYYFPEELERQLIVLRDRSGEAEIDLPAEVVMNLFVDVQGRVVGLTFDGEPPSAALQEQLRKAFMSMEFMPGMKHGLPVPSRMKIVIAPLLVPATKPEAARQLD